MTVTRPLALPPDVERGLRVALLLGWQDVRQRYRRSFVGPFWITMSIGVTLLALATVFGGLFGTPMREFLPYLAIGLITWNFFVSTLTEGAQAFVASEGLIKHLALPLWVYAGRVVWRNLIVYAHNVVILPLVFVAFGVPVGVRALLAVPALALLTAALLSAVMMLAIATTRYRDLGPIIQSVLQVVFYLTPVIWMPDLIAGRRSVVLVDLNPAHYLLDLLRAPLLGQPLTATHWWVAVGVAGLGAVAAVGLHRRYARRIAYWL